MKNLEVEIYMKNFKGFFDRNPDQLKKLIGEIGPDKFFNGVRSIVENNSTNEDKSLEPTKKDLIDLIVKLNRGSQVNLPLLEHHMGNIFLN